MKRRNSLLAALLAVLPLTGHAAEPKEVRLDYAYYAPTSLVLKDQGILEKRLAADGIAVKWVFSQGSNRSLEYFNGGSVDFASTAGLAGAVGRQQKMPTTSNATAARDARVRMVLSPVAGVPASAGASSVSRNRLKAALQRLESQLEPVSGCNRLKPGLQPSTGTVAITSAQS